MNKNTTTKERFQVLRDANRKPKLYLVDNNQDGAVMANLPLCKENEVFFNFIAEGMNVQESTGKSPKELAEENGVLSERVTELEYVLQKIVSESSNLDDAVTKAGDLQISRLYTIAYNAISKK